MIEFFGLLVIVTAAFVSGWHARAIVEMTPHKHEDDEVDAVVVVLHPSNPWFFEQKHN